MPIILFSLSFFTAIDEALQTLDDLLNDSDDEVDYQKKKKGKPTAVAKRDSPPASISSRDDNAATDHEKSITDVNKKKVASLFMGDPELTAHPMTHSNTQEVSTPVNKTQESNKKSIASLFMGDPEAEPPHSKLPLSSANKKAGKTNTQRRRAAISFSDDDNDDDDLLSGLGLSDTPKKKSKTQKHSQAHKEEPKEVPLPLVKATNKEDTSSSSESEDTKFGTYLPSSSSSKSNTLELPHHKNQKLKPILLNSSSSSSSPSPPTRKKTVRFSSTNEFSDGVTRNKTPALDTWDLSPRERIPPRTLPPINKNMKMESQSTDPLPADPSSAPVADPQSKTAPLPDPLPSTAPDHANPLSAAASSPKKQEEEFSFLSTVARSAKGRRRDHLFPKTSPAAAALFEETTAPKLSMESPTDDQSTSLAEPVPKDEQKLLRDFLSNTSTLLSKPDPSPPVQSSDQSPLVQKSDPSPSPQKSDPSPPARRTSPVPVNLKHTDQITKTASDEEGPSTHSKMALLEEEKAIFSSRRHSQPLGESLNSHRVKNEEDREELKLLRAQVSQLEVKQIRLSKELSEQKVQMHYNIYNK